jgi:hypothetical protein
LLLSRSPTSGRPAEYVIVVDQHRCLWPAAPVPGPDPRSRTPATMHQSQTWKPNHYHDPRQPRVLLASDATLARKRQDQTEPHQQWLGTRLPPTLASRSWTPGGWLTPSRRPPG